MNRKIFDMRDNPRYANVTRPPKNRHPNRFFVQKSMGNELQGQRSLNETLRRGFRVVSLRLSRGGFFPITDPRDERYISLP